jgi:amino-acid N-acetyltransferase
VIPMTLALRPADLADLAACRGLVDACGLPLGGLEHGFPGGYVVVVADEILVGCAGVELYGEAGLLRSVAVAPEIRGRGLGEQLTRDRIAYARAMRLGSLWLLTTTAPAYFSRSGFAPVDRTAAPESLRRSAEFADVCPASATCMRLLLDR